MSTTGTFSSLVGSQSARSIPGRLAETSVPFRWRPNQVLRATLHEGSALISNPRPSLHAESTYERDGAPTFTRSIVNRLSSVRHQGSPTVVRATPL